MGLNICVERSDGRDLAEWDCVRQVNDREFGLLLQSERKVVKAGDEDRFRPARTLTLRAEVRKRRWANAQRYIWLLDQLDADETLWIHLSY